MAVTPGQTPGQTFDPRTTRGYESRPGQTFDPRTTKGADSAYARLQKRLSQEPMTPGTKQRVGNLLSQTEGDLPPAPLAPAPGTMASQADGTSVDNPQPGTAVAPAVDALQARTQEGKPNVPPEQEDAMAGDEGFQRALAKSGAMTVGSKRPGKIGSKPGQTFDPRTTRGYESRPGQTFDPSPSKGVPAMLARPPADGVPLMLRRQQQQPHQPMSPMLGFGSIAPETYAAQADGISIDNPQPGTAVAPAGDALAQDEGFQRALAKSGSLTIGSKRPGKIGGKAGPTFSSGQFKGMTYDQARESWTSRNQGSNLMPRVNRTPQEVAAGSPVQRRQQRAFNTGAADGLPGQPASPQMDAFMRKLGGSPAAGAQGPTNSPAAARTAESALESRLTRATGGAAPGGDSIASAQTPAPTNPEKTPGFNSVRAGKN